MYYLLFIVVQFIGVAWVELWRISTSTVRHGTGRFGCVSITTEYHMVPPQRGQGRHNTAARNCRDVICTAPSHAQNRKTRTTTTTSLFIYSLVGRCALMTLPVTTLVGQSVEGSRLTSRYSTASARLEPGLSRYQNSTWYQVLRASGNTQIPRRAVPVEMRQ